MHIDRDCGQVFKDLTSSSSSRSIRQPLNDILSPGHAHDRHTRDLPDAPLEVAVVGGHDVDLVLHDAVDDAVIGVDALVVATQPLPALIARDAQGDAVLLPELLELAHDARRDDGRALGVQAVHHRRQHLELVLHRVGQEVGVHQHRVRRDQGGVVLEEES